MANYYITKLVCKSNNQLLQKINPRDIIKKRNSEFISCENGFYYFTTRNGTMHECIVELSKTYPTEVFISQIWDEDIFDSEIQTFKYKSGKSKCTKIEPNYSFFTSHIEKEIGKENCKRFMKIVLRHIKRIDVMSDTQKTRNRIERERKNKIKTTVTINVGNDDFKIEATKIGPSFIEVLGYIKEVPAPRWQLIEKEKNQIVRVVHKMDKSDYEEYNDVPF